MRVLSLSAALCLALSVSPVAAQQGQDAPVSEPSGPQLTAPAPDPSGGPVLGTPAEGPEMTAPVADGAAPGDGEGASGSVVEAPTGEEAAAEAPVAGTADARAGEASDAASEAAPSAAPTETPAAPTESPVDTASDAAPAAPTLDTPGDTTSNTQASEPAPTTSAPDTETTSLASAMTFLIDGGPAIWVIAALSVLTLALILWKTWRLSRAGAWSRVPARRAVEAWEQGRTEDAIAMVARRTGLRSRLTHAAMTARLALPEEAAREETVRVARRQMADQSSGLRALELIATIAPLLGLLGTVLGMIAAFQALQAAGNRADPALLAGGIWEALLTTAAGMAVAIPASAALSWFESVLDSVRADMEDIAARIFVTRPVLDSRKAA